MKILSVIHKELLQQLRAYKMVLFLTLLPIVIIMFMGLIFESVFSGEVNLDDVIVAMLPGDALATRTLEDVMLHEWEVKTVEMIETREDGKAMVANDEAALFIDLSQDQMQIYKNDYYQREAAVIEDLLGLYITQQSFEPYEELKNYTRVEKKEVRKRNDAMGYFGISMTMLFVFYGMPMHATSMITEKKRGTLARTMYAPIHPIKMLYGKILGNILVASFQVAVVLSVTRYMFDVNWGNPLLAWLLLESLVILVVALGITIGMLFDSEDKAVAFGHIIIVFIAFFGGSYMPLEGLGKLSIIGKFFSPIWWNMKAFMSWIYMDDFTMYLKALLVNGLGAVVLVVLVSLIIIKRNEVTHA